MQVKTMQSRSLVSKASRDAALSWDGVNLRWTDAKWKCVLWSEESTFKIVFRNQGRPVLWKQEKETPDY